MLVPVLVDGGAGADPVVVLIEDYGVSCVGDLWDEVRAGFGGVARV